MRVTKHKSPFYQYSRKSKVKELLHRLSETDQNEQKEAKAIQEIIQCRMRQLRQIKLQKSQQINLQVIKPSKIVEFFSTQKPINAGEKFLLQKKRMNIISPQKIYSSKPNVRAGSVDEHKKTNFFNELDPKVINKKFLQYMRILQEQNGSAKRRKITLQNQRKNSLPALSPPNKSGIRMKKTFFKKFPSDQFNFYKPPIKNITRVSELASQRSSLDGSRSILQSQNLSKKYVTLDSSQSYKRDFPRQSKTLDLYQQ